MTMDVGVSALEPAPCRDEEVDASRRLSVVQVCSARLDTRYGPFVVWGYSSRDTMEEFIAVSTGDLHPEVSTLIRIHSQCQTSEVFGSLRCDCATQLDLSLRLIQHEGRGVVVYQFQEGRGIGILNKIRAYHLQDDGADTVEANERLGFEVDLRSFSQCAEILVDLGLRRIRLISNNPAKIAAVRSAGLDLRDRIQLPATAGASAKQYLDTKQQKLGHLFEASSPVCLSLLLQDLVRARCSNTQFSEREVEPGTISAMLDAARWAASSFNEQPWRFVLVTARHDAEAYAKLVACLAPHNRVWARRAPVLMVAATKLTFSASGSPNDHALHDLGAAMANLSLQATALGVQVHQMGGADFEAVRRCFGIPEDYQPVTVSAIGYGCPDDERRPRPTRSAVEEFAFTGGWGVSRNFVGSSGGTPVVH